MDITEPDPYCLCKDMFLSAKDDAEYDMLGQHYTEVKRYIDNVRALGGVTLLSCNQGINRSGILAIAYVADVTGETLLSAAKHVVSRRWQACINRNFQTKLIAFAQQRGWRIEE